MPEIEVAASIPSVPPVTPLVNQPIKLARSILPTVTVVAVLLLLGLALGTYQFGKNKGPAQTPKLPTAELQTTPPSADPTTNWKTLTDTKYGFSLKYPKEWEFKPCTDLLCGTFFENNKEIIKLDGISNSCGLGTFAPTLEYAEKFSMCMCDASGPGINLNCESPKEEKTITNQYGIKYYSFVLNELKNNQLNKIKGPYNTIFFSKPILSGGVLNEYGLYFEVLDNNKILELDQILSTFKFLDQKDVNETFTIDFSACPAERKSVTVAFGSTTYEVIGKKLDACEINYGGEVENPNWDGQLNTNCQVPVSLGKVEFETTQYGIDFSPIKNYCVTKE